MMLVIDFLLWVDLIYEWIMCCWLEYFEELVDEFVKVWYKLIY